MFSFIEILAILKKILDASNPSQTPTEIVDELVLEFRTLL